MVVRYESSEARDLLGRAAGSLNRDKDDRERAAAVCLAAFEDLVREFEGSSPVFYTKRTSLRVVQFGQVYTEIAVFIAARDYGFSISTRNGPERQVKLDYNAATGVLEGEEEDLFTIPMPGESRRRRSALAVLTEAALETVASADSARAYP